MKGSVKVQDFSIILYNLDEEKIEKVIRNGVIPIDISNDDEFMYLNNGTTRSGSASIDIVEWRAWSKDKES